MGGRNPPCVKTERRNSKQGLGKGVGLHGARKEGQRGDLFGKPVLRKGRDYGGPGFEILKLSWEMRRREMRDHLGGSRRGWQLKKRGRASYDTLEFGRL